MAKLTPPPRSASLILPIVSLCLMVATPGCCAERATAPPVEHDVATLAGDAGLDADVLALALKGRDCALEAGELSAEHASILTVIDYSLPSTSRRLWVIDLDAGELLFHELVAHGKNTGANRARDFSNKSGSLQSSLGVFRTARTYSGKHGYSLRLDGLEPGFNDNARDRSIVIHGASYVTDGFAAEHGRLGRSWGCPALDPEVSAQVIDAIEGGTLLMVYYPDDEWLEGSGFLTCD